MTQPTMAEQHMIIQQYALTAMRMLKLQFPQLGRDELSLAVDYSIRKRMKDGDLYIENNYKHTKINTTVLEVANYILSREPIITAAGVMFKRHAETINPLCDLLERFLNQRGIYKDEMFKYPKGSEEFQKYNLLQLLEKLNANALYGVIGAPTSIFYNLFIAESVTTQGQSYTKAMMLAFESFLTNNVLFGSLNEVIHFIDNVVGETKGRKWSDKVVLDRDITVGECFYKIMSTCGFDGYYPDDRDLQIVWDILCNLNQEDINRLFYKNNLYTFMDNVFMTNMMRNLLVKLDTPFMNPNKPPKEISVEIEVFWDILKEYVYYGYMYIDRMGRLDTMIRKTCIIADTDSSIISLDAWFRYNVAKYYDTPMTIKRTLYSPFVEQEYDEFGDPDPLVSPFERIEEVMDFDFLEDETITSGYKLSNPWIIDPQEGFRYSIINIIAYCTSKMIIDYLRRYCINSGSVNKDRPESEVLMISKNEYLFKRALIVAQKNYCDIQELQEGNIVPEQKRFSIMGMPINKSTLNKGTRDALQKILYEDILKPDTIDQIAVLKKLCIFEKEIIRSIQSGKKEYLKPVTVKSMDHYDDPMRIFGIKAIIVYNELKNDSQSVLDIHARNNIHVVKLDLSAKNIERIKEVRPDKVDAVMRLLEIKQFKNAIETMAVPLNENIPEWILEFVDYTEVINANMTNFPLDQIGISKIGKNAINYSNILRL